MSSHRHLIFTLCLLFILRSNHVESTRQVGTAQIGVLIDFNHDVNKGVNDTSVEQLVRSIEASSSEHFVIEPSIIDDYDTFVTDIEDDPRLCANLTAIVTAVSCELTRNLYSVIENFCPGTVILSILDRACYRPSKYRGLGFPVRTSILDVVPMLMDMRYDFLRDWHQINLIHDQTIKEDHLLEIVSGLTSPEAFSNPPHLTAWSVAGPGSDVTVTTHLNCTRQSIRHPHSRFTPEHLAQHIREDVSMQHFIVIGKSGTIEEMIEQAHARNLMENPRRWLFVVTDEIKRKSYWDNLAPILALTNSAVIQRRLNKYAQCHRFSEDCQLVSIFSTLKEALHRASQNITRSGETILLDNRVFLRNRLVPDLRHLVTLPRHSDHCGNCDRFILKMFQMKKKSEAKKPWLKKKSEPKSVWVPDQDFSVYVSEEGEWVPSKGYMAKNHVYPAFLDKGVQFKETKLKVAIFQQLPRIRVNILEDGKCNVTGSTVQILRLLEERLNFTVEWICKEDHFGIRDSSGKWTGVMKLLVNGEAHMGGNGFWKLPSWRDEVKWSAAFYEESVSMMVQKSAEDHKWLFLLPFTWDVWYALIASVLLIGLFIYYVNWRCKYYDYNNIRKDKGLFSLGNCYWYSFGAMVNQGGDYLPPSLTSRMIVAFWWLFVIVVATAYSGNLVACLTFPKILQPIQNADDVAKSWFLKWAVQEKSPVAEVVKIEKYQPIAMLAPKMRFMDMAKQQKYIFDEVGDDSLVWLGAEEEIKYFVSLDYLGPNWEHKYDGLCRLHKAKDDVYRAPIYFPFHKNFDQNPNRREGMIYLINEQLMDLGMAGFIAHWMKYYAQLGNDCLHPTVVYAGDVRKIEMMHMYGSYAVLFGGMALSILFFIAELLYWHCIRPSLPEKWKTSSYNTLDYYNKVFVGYGYSNVRLEASQSKSKAPAQIPSLVQSIKAPVVPVPGPGSFGVGASAAAAAAGGEPSVPPVPRAGSSVNTDSIYNPNYTGSYNTRTNYNYYKYGGQKGTNYTARFGMGGVGQ